MLTNSIYLFAQQNGLGNEAAGLVLQNSIKLTENTAKSWQRIWDITVSPTAALWQALTELGLFIGAVSLIFVMIKESSSTELRLSRVIDMMKFPLGIVLMLAGNGYYLATVVVTMRSISLFWLTRILNITFAGISINDAIQKIQNTTVANSRAREIFSGCIDQVGPALQDCLQDPVKINSAQDLLQQLSGSTAPLNGNILERIGNGLVSALAGINSLPSLGIIIFVLNITQWAFVNMVEAALLMTALFAPVAMGLSMLPITAPTIFKWLSGYLSLLLAPLGYVLIVGFTANVLALTEQAGQPLGSSFVDVAFLLFMSIIAPIVALAVSKGIGDGVFEGITSGAKKAVEAGVGIASGGSSVAAKAAASKIAVDAIK